MFIILYNSCHIFIYLFLPCIMYEIISAFYSENKLDIQLSIGMLINAIF